MTIGHNGKGWFNKSLFSLKNTMCMTFRAPWLHCASFFLGNTAMCHSAFCHFSLQTNNYVHDSSKHCNVIEKCNAFISPMMQMGGGQKNMHGSFIIVQHMWNPFDTNFSSSQAVGEDMVNTCCTDYDLRSNCHAWNTPHMFKNRFHLFPKVSITDTGAPLQRTLSFSSQSFFMALTQQWTVSYEGTCVPKPSFDDLSQSSSLLSNKTWNFIHVLM